MNSENINSVTALSDFAKDTLRGLSAEPKRLFSKYFYDERGDAIFQQIMAMPEYYLTDCEFEIFRKQGENILAEMPDASFDLLELGAGDGTKTKVLLQMLLTQNVDFQYLPIDISQNALNGLEENLTAELPDLKIKTLQGDYFRVLQDLKNIGTRPKVVLFLGSNIGNFAPAAAVEFLCKMHEVLSPGDSLLIGADLKKDPAVIQAAYDDPAGITASFNLNLLERMNRELGADFDLDNWKHWETYNPVTGETKSHLVSKRAQSVHFSTLDRSFDFAAWEAVWVELSQKYSLSDLENIAAQCGYEVVKHFTDERGYYADSLWRKV